MNLKFKVKIKVTKFCFDFMKIDTNIAGTWRIAIIIFYFDSLHYVKAMIHKYILVSIQVHKYILV